MTADEVFFYAKQHFQYQSDMEVFRKMEYWISPSEIQAGLNEHGIILGDCDDFASLCAMLARRYSLPARFVFCRVETGEYHLVCEIEGWILDNRQTGVMRRDDLPYEWIAISGYSRGAPWHAIASKPSKTLIDSKEIHKG